MPRFVQRTLFMDLEAKRSSESLGKQTPWHWPRTFESTPPTERVDFTWNPFLRPSAWKLLVQKKLFWAVWAMLCSSLVIFLCFFCYSEGKLPLGPMLIADTRAETFSKHVLWYYQTRAPRTEHLRSISFLSLVRVFSPAPEIAQRQAKTT